MVKRKIKMTHPHYNPELIQISSMNMHFPQFKHKRNSEGNLIFTGVIQPKATMPIYTVSIEYRGYLTPRVTVIEPSLVEKPPHFYKGGYLCLYKPENFNWTATKPLSNYIIPWTSCWLYFYEVWKEKGIWLGPESKHDENLDKNE